MKKIKLLILFSFIIINNFTQAQFNAPLNYWYYRDRLKYFVVPGSNQGESEVMDVRNRIYIPEFFWEKPDYIHKNPVEEMIVAKPEDNMLSSAKDLC